ncbi:putative F-box protein At1g50870 [Coffea eugenioides]|uniref:putative F-box protein At1g50870 n=1 Tax=Coffea eugenioides TaxID=49369 RepID=UPI000F615210|nr:putative F-box protein At1g50870 [Coffea eugenioides]
MSDMMIPDELIEEIFSRLPVKTLIRFRCSSKPWQAVTGSPEFIRKNLTNSSSYTLIQGITKDVDDEEEEKYLYSTDYDSFLKIGCANFNELNLLVPCPRFDEILGSSNGLLCVWKENLWNEMMLFCGTHQLENIDVYRSLRLEELIANAADNTIVQVNRLKLDSWRRVLELPYHFEYSKNGKLANGTLHWVVKATSHLKSEELIAAVDLASQPLLWCDLESESVSYPETEVSCHPNNERPLADEYFELGILLQSLVKLSGESCESCRTNKKSRKLRRKRRT